MIFTLADRQHKELSISARRNIKSPPPRRKRRRKSVSEEVDTASLKIRDEEIVFDEDDLLYEAFDCKDSQNTTACHGLIAEKEEKDSLGQTVNISPSPKNSSDNQKVDSCHFENYSLSKNKKEIICDINKNCVDDCLRPEVVSLNTIDSLESSNLQADSLINVVIISDGDSESTDSDKTLSFIGSSLDGSQEF